MKKFVIFLLFVFVSCSVFSKDIQFASKESIETLLALTEAKQTYDAEMKDMSEMVNKSTERFLSQIATRNQEKFKKSMALFNVMLQDEMSWEKIKSQYVQIYAETFTQREINDLIAFYKTESGKAFIKKNPILNQKTSMIYQQKSLEVMSQFTKIVEKSINN